MPPKEESVRSIKTEKSMKTLQPNSCDYAASLPPFESSLPLACERFSCDFILYMKKEYQQDDFYNELNIKEKPVKYRRITMAIPIKPVSLSILQLEKKTEDFSPSVTSIDDNAIPITTIYDNVNNLIEINLSSIRCPVPRSLIQIICLLAPFYEYLRKITIKRCNISSTTLYELKKLLYTSNITDICLDGSPVRESCYFVFLDGKDIRIKYLSLCRCNINDDTCKEIANRLHFLNPAEKTLLLLNLSSNHITDEGAKHLGEALRTNRHLRYLNLADNRIGDDGASFILCSLMQFRLTDCENRNRRNRRFAYLRERNELITKYLNESETKSYTDSLDQGRILKKRKTSVTKLKNENLKKDQRKEKTPIDYNYKTKAELYANEIIGPYIDPYHPNFMLMKDNYCFCLGNTMLCSLNLSYNKLGYISVKKIQSVLQYQQKTFRRPIQIGLVKIVIEGNPLPATCVEYQNINELIRQGKSLQQFFGRRLSDAGAKRRNTRMSIVAPSAVTN